jgi:Flp pilus assembly protein TadG
LRRDERGNVAMIFGLTVAPLLFLAGAAVDYSGASNLRAKLQVATDAVNLQLCQLPGTPTDADMRTTATTYLRSYLGDKPFTILTLASANDPRRIELKTQANYPTVVVRALNSTLAEVPVEADASCRAKVAPVLEIALVLDNTGSMDQTAGAVSKMQAARQAATDFINYVYSAESGMSATTRISIVPFAAMVKVDPTSNSTANWVDQSGSAAQHWSFAEVGTRTMASSYGINNRLQLRQSLKTVVPSPAWDWAGCFESLPYPQNTQDVAPTSDAQRFVPSFAADEAGNGGMPDNYGRTVRNDAAGRSVTSWNSYLDDSSPQAGCAASTDENIRTGRACKYVQPTNLNTDAGRGPNHGCTSRPLTRLTNDRTRLLNEIAAMTAAGSTNIHQGVFWGWKTLSPDTVFRDGAAYNTLNIKKVMVVMTDGDNQWLSNVSNSAVRSRYSAYGYFRNPDGSRPVTIPADQPLSETDQARADAQGRAAIDRLTRETCDGARASKGVRPSGAPIPGIEIYTIGLGVVGTTISQSSIDMLRVCAGAAERAFVANDSVTLLKAFQDIAKSIGELRLTN